MQSATLSVDPPDVLIVAIVTLTYNTFSLWYEQRLPNKPTALCVSNRPSTLEFYCSNVLPLYLGRQGRLLVVGAETLPENGSA